MLGECPTRLIVSTLTKGEVESEVEDDSDVHQYVIYWQEMVQQN